MVAVVDKFLQRRVENLRNQMYEDIKTREKKERKKMAFFLKKDKIVQSPFIFPLVAKETRKNNRKNKWKKKDKIFINNLTAKSLEFYVVICRRVNSDRLNPGEATRERHAQALMPARTSFRYG